MKNLFSTIIMENNHFIGIVYNGSNNQEVYRTGAHSTQILAMRDTNNFIKRAQINNSLTNAVPGTTNTTQQTYSSPRRCCGR